MSGLEVVTAMGRAWVRLYTAGLPAETRDRRRREIESDLFEELAAGAGASPAPSVAGRFVRGVPADVAWRIERSMHADTDDELIATWHGGLAALLVVAIAVTSLIYAVLHTFGYFGDDHRVYAVMQVGLMIGSLVLLRGLTLTGESPRAGGALVVVVGLGMAFMWAFMPPIAIVLLAVTGYGALRAWRASRGESVDIEISADWVLALAALVVLSVFLVLGFVLIPLIVALAAIVIYGVVLVWRSRHRGLSPPP
jgi:hypothetical protein